ncbi:universal stress protein [Streptomyces sp. NPDC015130]|uniref:universal stress protein n=1 Tax=Streptomyces sp. NPDC015130 TaxID=3364940 RepID=UPI0036F8FE45
MDGTTARPGLGGFTSSLLGSVGPEGAAGTTTPVVVVRGTAEPVEAGVALAGVRDEADVGCARAGALVDASHHADLLVVGGRRSPGYLGPTIGRTTLSLLQHAHCPVELIPRQGPGHGSTS